MRNILFISFLLLLNASVFGQINRKVFNSFELPDINKIKFNFRKDKATFRSWPGTSILVEADIDFFNGTVGVFEDLISTGRYDLNVTQDTSSLLLEKNLKTKEIIGTHEVITWTVYIPECFDIDGEIYSRKESEAVTKSFLSKSGLEVDSP